jgi:hypothetical protein
VANKIETRTEPLAAPPAFASEQELPSLTPPREAGPDKRKELNNFDFLRFAAASLVILHHSYALLLKPEPFFAITGAFSFGDFAVAVFFVISGFLITASYERCRSAFPFLLSRFLDYWSSQYKIRRGCILQ